MSYTLKSFNTGQITLPKSWRSKYNTKHFLAEERDGGLFISPLMPSNTVFYESKEGFGIYNEQGIDPEEIIKKIKKLQNG